MIKVVSFDVGHTLIKYNNPLSWTSLYRPALCEAAAKCNIVLADGMMDAAAEILTKYNTRVNYRETEITSDIIFKEIMSAWDCLNADLHAMKSAFYSFFQADAHPFPEVIETLKGLKSKGIKTGILTDVAYGMDNEFSLKDFAMLTGYIDLILTSVDVGYRKPCEEGFLKTAECFNILPNEMIYVGDEEKDIVGANSVGAVSVLINRSNAVKTFNQNYTIDSLDKLCGIIDTLNL